MHIQKISISNLLGIEHLEFDAGQFNEISGRNGEGKTSILEAIKATLGSGHDATLLRKGQKQGEVVLVLDDGTSLRRRVGAEKSDNTVKQDGKVVPKPVDFLRRLADLTSVNPVDFLRATKKDRARVLLEAMPIVVDVEKLVEIASTRLKLPDSTHALQVIDAYRKQVYDDRTGTNRAVKEKEGTINQLRAALPDAPGGIEGSEDELRAQIKTHQDKHSEEGLRITNKLTGLREQRDAEIASIQDQIAGLQAMVANKREAFTEIEGKAQQQRNIAKTTMDNAVQPLHRALDAIVANRDAAAKRTATIETITNMEAELEDLLQDAETQTEALEKIDTYKAELLNSLPIPGLEVVDGDIYRDGVQFDRLNQAQQVQIAVDVAKLRTGELGLMCLDGVECLDSTSMEALRVAAEESGLQLFVSRVTDDEFNIKTE